MELKGVHETHKAGDHIGGVAKTRTVGLGDKDQRDHHAMVGFTRGASSNLTRRNALPGIIEGADP